MFAEYSLDAQHIYICRQRLFLEKFKTHNGLSCASKRNHSQNHKVVKPYLPETGFAMCIALVCKK